MLVLIVDVVSKIIVVAKLAGRPPDRTLGGAVYLVLTRNSGAAFSFAAGATVIFSAIAAAIIVLIVRVSSRLGSRGWSVAFGLILGGAAGNLSDRLFRAPGPLRGAVVDWLSLFSSDGTGWAIFNLADAAIVGGGVLAVLLMFLGVEFTGGRSGRASSD